MVFAVVSMAMGQHNLASCCAPPVDVDPPKIYLCESNISMEYCLSADDQNPDWPIKNGGFP